MARSEIRGFACFNELYERVPVVEAFRVLRSIGYDAIETFAFTPRPERIATESLRNLTRVGGAAGGGT